MSQVPATRLPASVGTRSGSQPAAGGFDKWELVVLLWFAFFLNQGDRQIYSVVLPLIGSDLKLDAVQLGLVATAFTVIRTDRNRDVLSDPAYEARVIARTPARFIGEPEDVAKAVVFLASPDARFITGATLFVDG